MLAAVIFLGLMTAVLAGVLTLAARFLTSDQAGAIDRVERVLPQTQCTQCGYPGCRPYAEAIVSGVAPIDLCRPGGRETIRALAQLLARPRPERGESEEGAPAAAVAIIAEEACIGCARCLQVCPVDAILGAPQYMHTVLEDECTGCELCIAPCPVDCISMRPRT